MTPETGQKIAYLICFVVISIAVTGYFIGLQSPMNPGQGEQEPAAVVPHSDDPNRSIGNGVVPATTYAKMPNITRQQAKTPRSHLSELKVATLPTEEVTISPEQKAFALAMREQNRAFNGAPPTIPHAIDQMSAQACVACHSAGMQTETLRIPRMSHAFLANCTQCHVEAKPQHMPASLFRENSFVGLPAPTGGPRAFPTAPPQIPHSTWMRVDCMSCHGPAGLYGIRTTHPWRQNCQQCHAPSSELDQVQLSPQPKFLAPPTIEQ